jgi:hypothetical protein
MQSIGLVRYALVKPWLAIVMADRVNDRAQQPGILCLAVVVR